MKRGYVDTPDGQIHYHITGDGPPVIILHATPTASATLVTLLEAFAAEGFTAIGMDTIGYGESDRPNPPYTTMEQFAQAVAWFIQGLGLEKVHLYGDKTGSQIALQTAADFPDLVASVAVFESFNWGTESRRAVHEHIHRYHPRSEDGSHIMALWNRTGNPSRKQDLRSREVALRAFLAVNDNTGTECYGVMGWEGAAPFAMTRQDMWSLAPRIQQPAFVMYGPNSELHRALEKFLVTLPHAKGTREAPSPRIDPEAGAKLIGDFFKNPGV